MKIIRQKMALIIFAVCVTTLSFFCVPRALAQTVKEQRSSTVWEESDNGLRTRVRVEGKVEFNEEYTDIVSVSDGGLFRVEEERGGTARRYEVVRAASGEMRRSYYVNGAARTFDAEAKSWLSVIVLRAVRQSGIDAEKRVQRILRARGTSGVLEEIRLIKSDYGKRIYFTVLIKNGSLASPALENVLREAARQINSDYEKSQLLIETTARIEPPAIDAYFDAARTIKSDYERRRVLTAAMEVATPRRELVLQAVRTAATITSDYEKATFLIKNDAFNLDEAQLRDAYFQAVRTVGSDYERRRVLSTLVKRGLRNSEALMQLLQSAATMSSDYEKATLLIEASSLYTSDARLRARFLETVETIKSDYERGRVLSALLKKRELGRGRSAANSQESW